MSQEFIKELERQKAKQAEQGGFNAPAPVAPGMQPQAPQELSAPQVGPTLASELQPDAKVPMVGGFEVRGAGADRFPLGTPEVPETLFSTEYTDPGGNTAAIAKIEAERARANAVDPQVSVEAPREFTPTGGAGFFPATSVPVPRDTQEKATFMGDVSTGLGKISAPLTAHSQSAGGFKPEQPAAASAPFGLADPTSSTATGEDPFSAPIVTPRAGPSADPDQQIRLADPTSSTVGLNSTQAMLQERFGSPTISGIQSAEEGLGLRTDAQGRMIDPNVDRSSFEQASADREARQAARPDFGEAQTRAAGTVTDRERRAARGDDMSDADRRDIAKANQRGASASDIARGDKVAALNGIDRKTGKPLEGGGLTVDQQLAIRKQLFAEGEAERKARVKEGELTTEAAEGKNRDFAAAEAMFASNQNIAEVGKKAQRQAGQSLTTGIAGALLSKLKPGSNAADMQANLDTLTADAAFSSLQTMRDNSKTGGALGAISERELTLLGAAQRSLASSQSPEQLKANIAAYLKIRSESMARVKAGFAKEYGAAEANRIFGGGSSEGSQGGQAGSRHANDQDHAAKVETHFQGK